MTRPAVLFDLDGTLVDTLDLLLASARHAFRERTGVVPTDAEWRAGIGTPLVRQLAPYATSDADVDALVAGYRAYQGEHHDRLTRLYPGVAGAIAALQAAGHALAIVTSKSETIAHRTLRHVGLAGAMPVVVGYESTTQHKPDPEPVHRALALIGRAPHEAVFVGDSPHDMQAGAAAGVVTVAALWGFFDRAAIEAGGGADHYLADARALPALVARIGGG